MKPTKLEEQPYSHERSSSIGSSSGLGLRHRTARVMDQQREREGDITTILRALEKGDANAPSALLLLIYDELRRRASRQMRGQSRGHTLQTTALVHDAYENLFGAAKRRRFENREHFYATASKAMRNILVRHARGRSNLKSLPQAQRVPLEAIIERYERSAGDLGKLSEAIDELEERDPYQAKIVVIYYFGGLTREQVAEAMGISVSSAYREIRTAILILRSIMNDE